MAQALATASLVLAAIFVWFPSLALGRGVFFLVLLFLPSIALAWRLVGGWRQTRTSVKERLLIEGCGAETVRLARELHSRRHELGIHIVGFVDRDPAMVGLRLFNPSVIGTVDDLPALISIHAADRVAVSTISVLDELPLERLLGLRVAGVSFDHLAGVYEEYTGKLAIETLTPSALMFAAGFKQRPWLRAVKRGIDLLVSLIGLTIGLPLMALIAVAIKVSSSGPALYRQTRVGGGGRHFTLYKFRSMQHDAEMRSGPTWAQDNDPRATRVGRVLRHLRLDELPQLFNVLRGDMSLVGPRPERPELERQLIDLIPLYVQRQLVKPGLTGWSQVRHGYCTSIADARVKLQYDLFYIKNMSLALDLLILLMTTKTVLRRVGAR
jgi:exopolysaccharide biosynthesis polyprenyl glycosylphosphotransferase